MAQIGSFLSIIFITITFASPANEINYNSCKTIEEMIMRETNEIAITNPYDFSELAQLHVSRGESYLLDAQYEKALEDFKQVDSYLEGKDIDPNRIIAFRSIFGKVVSYDNLGKQKETEQALRELQYIADHAGCDDCRDDRPCLGMCMSSNKITSFPKRAEVVRNTICHKNKIAACGYARNRTQQNNNLQGTPHDDYKDILGPNSPPSSDWCEEVVVGTGRAMEIIAGLAPNYAVKAILIAIIEGLITKSLKCCRAGGFWKSCVAPLVRKWQEWKKNKESNLPPNSDNLPLYTKETV